MITGLFLTLLALVGIIAIMVWIVQLPLVALLINIGLIALAAWIVQGPFVALLAIVGFVAVILSALRVRRIAANFASCRSCYGSRNQISGIDSSARPARCCRRNVT